MIYVTAGHEKGIGLEVFLKSYSLLSRNDQKKICLIIDKKFFDGVKKRLFLSKLDIKILEPSFKDYSFSLNSLLTALKVIKKNDVLFTLPTSKDQLKFKNKTHLGYTEFLRSFYKNQNLSMFFYSDYLKVLLLTDHLPLKNVSKIIMGTSLKTKLDLALKSLKQHKIFKSETIYYSGFNPHAGESGLLGKEDIQLKKNLNSLKIKNLKGPLPGDTLHLIPNLQDQLLIYTNHEQGLPFFKSKAQFLGANITLGLSFIRLSVDHGTAFDLYGKNKANYLGCLYCLKLALKFQK